MNKLFRLGVIGSGAGSNFVAIAEAIDRGLVPAEVAVVLSDVEDSGILAHARHRSLPGIFIPPGKFRTKLEEEAEQLFVSRLQTARVDLVVLAGLVALGPLDHELPGPEFGVCLGLDFGFWLGWAALIISWNCWLISRFSAAGRA